MDCSLIGTAASPVRHGKVSTIGKESEMDDPTFFCILGLVM